MCRPASQLWISLVLVLFSVLFSLIRCAPTVDYRMDDFDWKPITWMPFTWKPFTWKPFTWKPIDWGKPTSSPGDYNDYSTSSKFDPALFCLIVLPGVALYVIIVVCKQYCCENSSSSTYVSSSTTLHAPPRNRTNVTRNTTESVGVHRPPPSSRREGTQLYFNNRMADFSSDSSRSNFSQSSNNIPRNNPTFPTSDRPPDYAHVIYSDLWEPDINNFPTVNQNPAESPPPNYNPENIPKF